MPLLRSLSSSGLINVTVTIKAIRVIYIPKKKRQTQKNEGGVREGRVRHS